MALVIRGQTICDLCGEIIAEGDDVTTFPAFVHNEIDPLFCFNDAPFHTECVKKHPIGERAVSRADEWLSLIHI